MKKLIVVLMFVMAMFGCTDDGEVNGDVNVHGGVAVTIDVVGDEVTAPSILKIEDNGTDITVFWSDESASIYEVFVRVDGVSFDYTTPEWDGVENSCVIDELTVGTTYFIVVRSIGGGKTSASSNEAVFER